MNEKNIKNSIKTSDKLDDYILKGIERGREEKHFRKNKNKIRTVAKASSILLIGTLGLGVINPDIVRAIPIIGKALEGFESSNFGEPTDKYLKYSQGIELISEDKNATIIVNDVIVDENMVMIGMIIESDALEGFKGKNPGDFINISSEITLDGKSVDGVGHRARQIDDRSGAVIISANIAELKLDDDVEVDFNVDSIKGASQTIEGNWEFKINTTKVKDSRRINIGKEYDVKNQKLVVDEVVVSPFVNTVLFSGIDDTTNFTLQSAKYKVIDDKGNILKSDNLSSSVDTKNGRYSGKIKILGNLENTKYIDLIPYWGFETIDEIIKGVNVELLTTTGSGERENSIISRKPTKQELDSGYSLSKVYYNLNMDKNKEFLSLDELKGYEIAVNDKEKVIIKDIQVSEEDTKVTMKVEGGYDYNYLSQLVIFDEEMNDTARWEGHIGAVVEDEKEGIYSITLDKIDTSKKYKIAVPMTKNIDLSSEYKVRINLK